MKGMFDFNNDDEPDLEFSKEDDGKCRIVIHDAALVRRVVVRYIAALVALVTAGLSML